MWAEDVNQEMSWRTQDLYSVLRVKSGWDGKKLAETKRELSRFSQLCFTSRHSLTAATQTNVDHDTFNRAEESMLPCRPRASFLALPSALRVSLRLNFSSQARHARPWSGQGEPHEQMNPPASLSHR